MSSFELVEQHFQQQSDGSCPLTLQCCRHGSKSSWTTALQLALKSSSRRRGALGCCAWRRLGLTWRWADASAVQSSSWRLWSSTKGCAHLEAPVGEFRSPENCSGWPNTRVSTTPGYDAIVDAKSWLGLCLWKSSRPICCCGHHSFLRPSVQLSAAWPA